MWSIIDMSTFSPFDPFAVHRDTPTTVSNLAHRLDMAVRAALQAQHDYEAGRQRAGMSPEPARFFVRDPASPNMPQGVADPQAAAAAILQAGRKRRGELHDDDVPPANSMAGQILRAGRVRRGED